MRSPQAPQRRLERAADKQEPRSDASRRKSSRHAEPCVISTCPLGNTLVLRAWLLLTWQARPLRNSLLLLVSPPPLCRCLCFFIALKDTSDDAPSQKEHHMCLCVCYYEGTLKQFNAPSARMLRTNQHVESSQAQFLHMRQNPPSALLPCTITQQKRLSRQLNSDGHVIYFLHPSSTQDSSGSHNIYQALCISWHFQGHVTA